MKSFVVVVAFLSVAVLNARADISKEQAIAVLTGCQAEAGASDADVENMIKHKPAATKEDKCMRACAFKKFGVLNDNGKIVKDVATEFAKHFIKDEDKKALAAEIIAACEDLKVSDDHCEAAEEYGECARAEFDKKGVSIDEEFLS